MVFFLCADCSSAESIYQGDLDLITLVLVGGIHIYGPVFLQGFCRFCSLCLSLSLSFCLSCWLSCVLRLFGLVFRFLLALSVCLGPRATYFTCIGYAFLHLVQIAILVAIINRYWHQ